MAPRIYTSFWPGIPDEPYTNAFTYAFPPAGRDHHPPSTAAYIDARTGLTITRADVRRIVLEIAYGLREVLPGLVRGRWDGRLGPGDAVMLFTPNSVAFPLALHGVLTAGLVTSPANAAYTSHELLNQFRDSQSKVVFVHPTLVPIALETLKLAGFNEQEARARIIICDYRGLGGPIAGTGHSKEEFTWLEDLIGKGTLTEEANFDGERANTTAFLCYSSGTTGKPKGVMSSHKNIVSVGRMLSTVPFYKDPIAVEAGLAPFFHITGLTMLLFVAPQRGHPVVVFERFDPIVFMTAIQRYGINVVSIVPPIIIALLRHLSSSATDKYDLRSLTTVVSGAAPLGAPLAKAFREKMAAHGAVDIRIHQGYGLTETSPAATLTPRDWADRKLGTSGALLPGLEARLVEDDGVTDAPEGGPGELWIRGPNVMKGYLNNEAATRQSITDDGWFKTGDIATRDVDGFYAIIDRKKELIKYKGFQVPPAELESVLLQHPNIADAAVIGVDDPTEATELPRAYIVPADLSLLHTDAEKTAFASQVQAWVRGRVARHKQLRGGVVMIDAIPKSASGKILRKHLRERAKQEREREGGQAKAKL